MTHDRDLEDYMVELLSYLPQRGDASWEVPEMGGRRLPPCGGGERLPSGRGAGSGSRLSVADHDTRK